MIEQYYQSLQNVPIKVKNLIHTVNIYDSDSSITCNTEILSVADTLKKDHLGSNTFNEFTSKFNDDKDYGFRMLFKQYTMNYFNNINHPALIQEWKYNM